MSEYASDTDADIRSEKPEDIHTSIPWADAHENILVEWADKGLCYRWLHSKAHAKYSRANAGFTIPVIIMSTVTGTANFAQDKFPDGVKEYAPMGIGAINIFAGILTTIQQFLKIGELNEAHRVSSISWDKFYRNIKVELAKSPSERIPVLQMLKITKEEFDRLMETSPIISDSITTLFQNTFTDGKDLSRIPDEELSRKQKLFTALKKPEICDELISCKQYVYKETKADKDRKSVKSSINMAKKAYKQQYQIIQIKNIIASFINMKQRPPNEEEIMDELDEDSDISIELIVKTLSETKQEKEKFESGENAV